MALTNDPREAARGRADEEAAQGTALVTSPARIEIPDSAPADDDLLALACKARHEGQVDRGGGVAGEDLPRDGLHHAIDECGKRVLSEALIALWHTHKPAIWQAACAQFGTGFGGKF